MGDAEKMALQHYKYFLTETAKSLGMTVAEVQQIEGFQSPEQVQKFIDFLVHKYGFSQKELMLLPVAKTQQFTTYNEWEMNEEHG